MRDLSILIPARNEQFLAKTVEDILKNERGNTEVIVVLDGEWADPPIKSHPDVTVIYHSKSIGQRASQNEAARLSKAKYLMKVDAHCAFDEGFDVKMIKEMQDDWTMVPNMKNLHAFDWVCKFCGFRQYQGPKPEKCPECTGANFEKDVVWIAKPSPNSTSYCVNKNLQFKYFNEYKKKQRGDIVDTMSLQGSCFMVTREKYWELGLCDESWGSWGQQGAEVALKTWLSGGRVVCNKKTWYAHLFRTQPGFRWPYPRPGRSQKGARKLSRDIFFNNKWPKQIYPLSWLLTKFWPIYQWDEEDLKKQKERERTNWKPIKKELTKGILFYTDNQLKMKIAKACQGNLKKIGLPIVSVSLKPMPHFGTNIHLKLKRGPLTMFKQILAGLEASKADIIFFCEHDVLYHPSHFDFMPPKKDVFYYNTEVWKVRVKDGHGLKVDDCKQTSGLCAYRDLLLKHYRKRVKMVEKDGFTRRMGFEPGTHGRKERVDDYKAEAWRSKGANLDIRHDKNLTPTRWDWRKFRNQKYTRGWMERDIISYWGKLSKITMLMK